MLPTEAGFFFGSTEYDAGYEQDLKDTIEMIGGILNNPRFTEDWEFEYRSSW